MQLNKTIFMFSGLGSQYFQMGKALYQGMATFRSWMDRMDSIVCELTDCSVVDTLYNDGHSKTEAFDRTQLSHAAIFMVEYALAQTLIEADIVPDITLGASLGSFAAATLSGCVSFEDAIQAVVNQAKIFEEYCQNGGMIAILADPRIYQENILKNNCQIASYNFSSHFVVSAKYDFLNKIENFLREKEVSFQRLPVSFAYHSRWIDEAETPCKAYLRSITPKRATIPNICCAQSTIVNSLSPDHFWTIAREPILFQQTIEQLELEGEYQYIDVGPAGTLATFLKYTLPSTSASKVLSILTPFGRDIENLASIKAAVS